LNILVLILAFSFSQLTLADTFELIKDGKTYSCSQKTQTPADPNIFISCVSKAQKCSFSSDPCLTNDQSVALCKGTVSDAPAACAAKAQACSFSSDPCLTKDLSVVLCKGTTDNSPAVCAAKARKCSFSSDPCLTKEQAAEACKAQAKTKKVNK
jgi:hypothetical protein